MGKTRAEYDSFGEVRVPVDAYWGAHTQRAVENFDVSPYRMPPAFLRALALVKRAAAHANGKLKTIPPEAAKAIERAAEEVETGRFDDQFPVDVFQTGSGTSWNMNINEVIARRAGELAEELAEVHPNDTVNRGQSSNDVIPTALNIAAVRETERLLVELGRLEESLKKKEDEYDGVIKLGRTHLQDAVPMTFAQEISGWRSQVSSAAERIERAAESSKKLPLGGTAIGTGLNSSIAFAKRALRFISRETGISFAGGGNRFAGIAARDESLELMGELNGLAVVLTKIAEDLRLLSSGPRGGFGELVLPPLQPGSSIMPGKVNPVVPEMVVQAAVFVTGKYSSVSSAAGKAPLQLNIMQPLIAHELLGSVNLLTRVVERLREKTIEEMTVDVERSSKWVEESLALVTPLAKTVGYDKAAHIAHRAYEEHRSLFDVAREENLLHEEELRRLFDPSSMTGPF